MTVPFGNVRRTLRFSEDENINLDSTSCLSDTESTYYSPSGDLEKIIFNISPPYSKYTNCEVRLIKLPKEQLTKNKQGILLDMEGDINNKYNLLSDDGTNENSTLNSEDNTTGFQRHIASKFDAETNFSSSLFCDNGGSDEDLIMKMESTIDFQRHVALKPEAETNFSSDLFSDNDGSNKDLILNSESIKDGEQSKKTSKSKRKGRTRDFCVFCKSIKTNIARHFEIAHRNEKDVVAFLKMDKRSHERSKIITEIKNRGNVEHNNSGEPGSHTQNQLQIASNSSDGTEIGSPDTPDVSPERVGKKSEANDKHKRVYVRKTETKYSKKKEFCIFCRELKTNIARHFEIMHDDEEEVSNFLRVEKKSLERAKIIRKLTNKGNFKYNMENKKELILVRRRYVYNKPEKPEEYFLPCPTCKAYFSRKYLSKHHERCSEVPTVKGTIRSVIRDSRSLTTDLHPLANDVLKTKIIPPMRRDNIFETLKNDKLIVLFGNHFTPKYIGHQEYMIRQRLRFLGRYLVIIQKLCPDIKQLLDLFHPRHFEIAVDGINRLAGLSIVTGAYASPELALEMVHNLKVCSAILESTYIKEGRDKKQKGVKKISKLLYTESAGRINKPAHRDLIAHSRQTKVQIQTKIPLSDDIKIFKSFLLQKAEYVYRELMNSLFDFLKWKELSEMTLLYITVYNRKRSGEAHLVLVEDFLNMHTLTNTALPEMIDTLNDNEKLKAQSIYKVLFRGKLERTVCAFIPYNVKLFLDYIYQHRNEANIPTDNPYLFGLPGKLSGLRHKTLETCSLMRKYTNMANLQNPNNIRTTLLRKHLATKVSTLNLKEAQQETVHDFMGHHERIHKGFYRQQVITKDLMMNKILDQDSNVVSKSDRDSITTMDEIISCSSCVNNNLSPKKRKLEVESGTLQSRKKTSASTTSIASDESTVDSENEKIYERNLHIIKTTPSKYRKLPTKQRWTTPQKRIIQGIFSHHIVNRTYPTGDECRCIIDKTPILQNRTIPGIKSYLQHCMRKRTSSNSS